VWDNVSQRLRLHPHEDPGIRERLRALLRLDPADTRYSLAADKEESRPPIGDKRVAGARGADTCVRASAGIRHSRRRRGCLCPMPVVSPPVAALLLWRLQDPIVWLAPDASRSPGRARDRFGASPRDAGRTFSRARFALGPGEALAVVGAQEVVLDVVGQLAVVVDQDGVDEVSRGVQHHPQSVQGLRLGVAHQDPAPIAHDRVAVEPAPPHATAHQHGRDPGAG
jgi:hypothetical protein